jgi:hypothetical protein
VRNSISLEKKNKMCGICMEIPATLIKSMIYGNQENAKFG